ncbi:MAG: membrane protein [Rhodothermaceae bacterium]|nr:MAG: membrane protein [Rhodothermaceae bacterium]
MDSFTQFALGATVGELAVGRKLGNRALLWGGALGTLPDLDVLVNPFVSEVQELAFHRGLSHSLFFCIAAAPLLGSLLAHLHRSDGVTRREGVLTVFLALSTHVALDLCTTYPTQLLQPFSDATFALSSIFIIDPLYTLPLVAGLVAALRRERTDRRRRRAVLRGLGVSTLYLLLTLVNKQHVSGVFARALAAQGHTYERLHTAPTPFNNLLWVGLADDGEGYRVGLYSLLDEAPPRAFLRLEKNQALLAPFLDDPPVRRLIWFSDGYYAVSRRGDSLFFSDLRFARDDLWLTGEGASVFRFLLERAPEDSTRIAGFRRHPPALRPDAALLRCFGRRLLGAVIPPGGCAAARSDAAGSG